MLKTKNNQKKRNDHNQEEEYFESNNHFDGGNGSQAEEDSDEETQNDGDNESDQQQMKKIVKVRTVIRKPQPKLDPARVCGVRGLKCLLEEFKKFKSKEGHEFSDLNLMMAKYEYWAHRMYPKMRFKDVIERLEKLGEKREIRAQLNSLRLGDLETTSADGQVDLAEEDEQMTARVMDMMRNIDTSDEETDQPIKTTKNQSKIDEESEDEDELFNKLLNEHRLP